MNSAARSRTLARLRWLLHPYLLFLLVALAVWWPDGYNIGLVNDGWAKLAASDDTLIRLSTRAFGAFAFRLSKMLAWNNFESWQYMLLVLTVMRAALWFEVVRRIFPRHRMFAIACGLITLFHPADGFYFWVDAIGIDFAYVLTLAFCLAALANLQTGSRVSLAALYFFQLLACLTYSGFLLIIIAFPVGIWILRRIEGAKVHVHYLLKTTVPILLFIGLVAVLSSHDVGREGKVMDASLHGVIAGFAFAAKTLVGCFRWFWSASEPAYWMIAVLPGVFAYMTEAAGAASPERAGPQEPKPRAYYAAVLVGLLILSALSYMPFSLANVRFGNTRQLFAAGIFFYMIPLFLLFVSPPDRMRSMRVVALTALAVCVTVCGLEQRKIWVDRYRIEERLLAAVAATIPEPPPGSVIVVNLDDKVQAYELGGFSTRRRAFTTALGLMYGDASLSGGFTDLERPLFVFDKTGIEVEATKPENKGLTVPYDRLILLQYSHENSARILDRAWLQQQAPKGTDLSAYAPGNYGSAPGKSAIICTLLEKDYRPAYCD